MNSASALRLNINFFDFEIVAFSSAPRYDSLTGVPSSQRALAFEKGSVLFNIGALYTQIGARQDRSATAGIDRAIDAFQRAAGTEPADVTFHCRMSFLNTVSPHVTSFYV